jgi:hypothetical protein
VVVSSSEVELLASWNSRITAARRTKTVRQKWQELLLSVSGECCAYRMAYDESSRQQCVCWAACVWLLSLRLLLSAVINVRSACCKSI